MSQSVPVPKMTLLFLTPLPLTSRTNNILQTCPRRPTLPTKRRMPRADASPPPPKTPSEKGEALVRAAMLGSAPTVKSLLQDGASPGHASIEGDSGMTALMWASAEGHVEIVRMLLESGAPPNAETSQKDTALIYVFENLPSENPRAPPPAGFPGRPDKPTPPQIPVVKRVTGHSAIAKMLLAAGANPKVKNRYAETLLHLAARKAQLGWVDLCISIGIGLEEKSVGYEETALHIAAKEGHTDVVRLLCERGAVVDARNRYGWTPLIWASACGNARTVEVLLEFDADPNAKSVAAQGVDVTTPLREGRKCSRPDVVSKLLIRAGAIE